MNLDQQLKIFFNAETKQKHICGKSIIFLMKDKSNYKAYIVVKVKYDYKKDRISEMQSQRYDLYSDALKNFTF